MKSFVIDRLPDHPNVILLLGAAHGFKFASLFGKIAAQLALDGQSESGWTRGGPRHRKLDLPKPERGPDFVKHRSERLVVQVGGALRGFDAHPGPKILITYEQLRGNTKEAMRRIGSELQLPGDPAVLDAIVDKHAWENVPEEEKGSGKIRRKAKPGGWEEDLTPEQVSTIEDLAGPIFERFYAD